MVEASRVVRDRIPHSSVPSSPNRLGALVLPFRTIVLLLDCFAMALRIWFSYSLSVLDFMQDTERVVLRPAHNNNLLWRLRGKSFSTRLGLRAIFLSAVLTVVVAFLFADATSIAHRTKDHSLAVSVHGPLLLLASHSEHCELRIQDVPPKDLVRTPAQTSSTHSVCWGDVLFAPPCGLDTPILSKNRDLSECVLCQTPDGLVDHGHVSSVQLASRSHSLYTIMPSSAQGVSLVAAFTGCFERLVLQLLQFSCCLTHELPFLPLHQAVHRLMERLKCMQLCSFSNSLCMQLCSFSNSLCTGSFMVGQVCTSPLHGTNEFRTSYTSMFRFLFLRFSINRPATMGDFVDGSFFMDSVSNMDSLNNSTASALAQPGFGTDVSRQQAAAAQADSTSADSDVAFGSRMQQAGTSYLSGIKMDPSGWFVKTPVLDASAVDPQQQLLFDSALAPKAQTADPYEGPTTAAAGSPDVPQRAIHHFLQLLGQHSSSPAAGAANLSLAGRAFGNTPEEIVSFSKSASSLDTVTDPQHYQNFVRLTQVPFDPTKALVLPECNKLMLPPTWHKVLGYYDTPEFRALKNKREAVAFTIVGHIDDLLDMLGSSHPVLNAILHRFDVLTSSKQISENTAFLKQLVAVKSDFARVGGLQVFYTACAYALQLLTHSLRPHHSNVIILASGTDNWDQASAERRIIIILQMLVGSLRLIDWRTPSLDTQLRATIAAILRSPLKGQLRYIGDRLLELQTFVRRYQDGSIYPDPDTVFTHLKTALEESAGLYASVNEIQRKEWNEPVLNYYHGSKLTDFLDIEASLFWTYPKFLAVVLRLESSSTRAGGPVGTKITSKKELLALATAAAGPPSNKAAAVDSSKKSDGAVPKELASKFGNITTYDSFKLLSASDRTLFARWNVQRGHRINFKQTLQTGRKVLEFFCSACNAASAGSAIVWSPTKCTIHPDAQSGSSKASGVVRCSICKKRGHLDKDCRSAKKTTGADPSPVPTGIPQRTVPITPADLRAFASTLEQVYSIASSSMVDPSSTAASGPTSAALSAAATATPQASAPTRPAALALTGTLPSASAAAPAPTPFTTPGSGLVWRGLATPGGPSIQYLPHNVILATALRSSKKLDPLRHVDEMTFSSHPLGPGKQYSSIIQINGNDTKPLQIPSTSVYDSSLWTPPLSLGVQLDTFLDPGDASGDLIIAGHSPAELFHSPTTTFIEGDLWLPLVPTMPSLDSSSSPNKFRVPPATVAATSANPTAEALRLARDPDLVQQARAFLTMADCTPIPPYDTPSHSYSSLARVCSLMGITAQSIGDLQQFIDVHGVIVDNSANFTMFKDDRFLRDVQPASEPFSTGSEPGNIAGRGIVHASAMTVDGGFVQVPVQHRCGAIASAALL